MTDNVPEVIVGRGGAQGKRQKNYGGYGPPPMMQGPPPPGPGGYYPPGYYPHPPPQPRPARYDAYGNPMYYAEGYGPSFQFEPPSSHGQHHDPMMYHHHQQQSEQHPPQSSSGQDAMVVEQEEPRLEEPQFIRRDRLSDDPVPQKASQTTTYPPPSVNERILRNPYPHVPLLDSSQETYDPRLPTYNATPIQKKTPMVASTIDSIFQIASQKMMAQAEASRKQQLQTTSFQPSTSTKTSQNQDSFQFLPPPPAPAAPIAAQPESTGNGGPTEMITGIVTHMQDMFGMISSEVFFQTSTVVGRMPVVGDKVVVEAERVEGMPFKFNAKRVQLLSQDLTTPGPSPTPTAATAPPPPSKEMMLMADGSLSDYGRRDEMDFGPLPSMPNSLNLRPPAGAGPKSILKRNPPPPPKISSTSSKAKSVETDKKKEKYRPESPVGFEKNEPLPFLGNSSYTNRQNKSASGSGFSGPLFTLDIRGDFPVLKQPSKFNFPPDELFPELSFVTRNNQLSTTLDKLFKPQSQSLMAISVDAKKKESRRHKSRSPSPPPSRNRRRSRSKSKSPTRRSNRRRSRSRSHDDRRRSRSRSRRSRSRSRSRSQEGRSSGGRKAHSSTTRSRSRDRKRRDKSRSTTPTVKKVPEQRKSDVVVQALKTVKLMISESRKMDNPLGFCSDSGVKAVVGSSSLMNSVKKPQVPIFIKPTIDAAEAAAKKPSVPIPIKIQIGGKLQLHPQLVPNPVYSGPKTTDSTSSKPQQLSQAGLPKWTSKPTIITSSQVSPTFISTAALLASVEKSLKKKNKLPRKPEEQKPAYVNVADQKEQEQQALEQASVAVATAQNNVEQQRIDALKENLNQQKMAQLAAQEKLLLGQQKALEEEISKSRVTQAHLGQTVEEKLKGLREHFDAAQTQVIQKDHGSDSSSNRRHLNRLVEYPPSSSSTVVTLHDENHSVVSNPRLAPPEDKGRDPRVVDTDFLEEEERREQEVIRQQFLEEERRLKRLGNSSGLNRLYHLEDRRMRRIEENRLERLSLEELKLKEENKWMELKAIRETHGSTAQRDLDLCRLISLREAEETQDEEEEVRRRDYERAQRGSEGPVRRLVMDTQIRQLQAAGVHVDNLPPRGERERSPSPSHSQSSSRRVRSISPSNSRDRRGRSPVIHRMVHHHRSRSRSWSRERERGPPPRRRRSRSRSAGRVDPEEEVAMRMEDMRRHEEALIRRERELSDRMRRVRHQHHHPHQYTTGYEYEHDGTPPSQQHAYVEVDVEYDAYDDPYGGGGSHPPHPHYPAGPEEGHPHHHHYDDSSGPRFVVRR